MAISFNEIPLVIRTPDALTEVDNTRANQGPGILPFKCLIVGQRLSTGTVAALTPKRITSAQQAANYFGEGSILHRQAIAWFEDNTLTEVWAVAFDDPSGAAATGNINFSGPSTAAGTLNLYIGGERVQVAVTSGQSATDIAAAVQTAIAAKTSLPVTAQVNGSDDTQVDITARNDGLLGNDIDVRINYFEDQETPAGVGAVVTALSGGSGAPDFDTLWPVLGDEWYNVMAIPHTDSASHANIDNEMGDRSGPMRQIPCEVFAANDDTHSNLGTFGNARNSEFISVISPAGKNSPTPSFEIGANYAAVAAYYLSIDPARPLQTLELSHVLPPAKADRFTQQENNLLLFDGIATAMIDAGGNVLIQRAITLYQENALGADDASYLDVNTLFTITYLRWSVRNRILLRFPRSKLANDGTKFGAGQEIVTPKSMKSEIFGLFLEWETIGLVENADQFKDELIVERNSSDPNRLDVQMPPDLVNQLRVTAIQVQFIV